MYIKRGIFVGSKYKVYQGGLVVFLSNEKEVGYIKDIKNFVHPEKCIYLLGAEDNGIPEKLMKGVSVVHISTPMCLNVAVTGSIVMFDRFNKIYDEKKL